jgi:hypothetical protein
LNYGFSIVLKTYKGDPIFRPKLPLKVNGTATKGERDCH